MNPVAATDHDQSPILDQCGPQPVHPAAPSDQYAVDLAVDGDHAVEWVSGEVDTRAGDRLVEVGSAALDQARVGELVFDLSRVTFLDASGLGVLVRLRASATALGKRFALRGVTSDVADLLALTGLAATFGVRSADAGRC